MRTRKYRFFSCDFETTVFKGQKYTEVWAAACVELYSEDVHIFTSISEQFEYFKSLKENVIGYYHNLKFDGAFWLSFLLIDIGLQQAETHEKEDLTDLSFLNVKDMPNNSFSYSISDTGQWYRITIKINNHIIEFRDSMKLLPFSVKRIGQSFQTKHKKLEIEYEGIRFAGGEITQKEREYIANDVLVVKEALEIMFNENHKKLTIGSCCLSEFKKSIGGKTYDNIFPDLYGIPLDDKYGSNTVGDYINKSYHGGWCYLVKGKERKLYKNGTTADVNSLYPSMMSSESGNFYPYGEPTFWTGDFIPDEVTGKYWFVRFKTRFYIKDNMLPFIQIKNTAFYKFTEMLETSDVYNPDTGEYDKYIIGLDGNIQSTAVTLTMTMTDYKLFLEHYRVEDFEILDGCYFNAKIGIFDKYIEKYKQKKLKSKGAKRELAKLFLNNLYGKMAASPISNFKYAYVKPDKTVGFYTVLANDKKPGYIAVGSAITSYARNFTIRAAQQNYYGKNAKGFIYADTDSIHCDLPPEKLKGIEVHDKNFCCWKIEGSWDSAWFVRQKTYIEHIVKEGLIDCDPHYSVKCAGMPQRCKDLFLMSIGEKEKDGKLTDDERDFLSTPKKLTDFDIGLRIPSKLRPKRILGGIVLEPTTYEMR